MLRTRHLRLRTLIVAALAALAAGVTAHGCSEDTSLLCTPGQVVECPCGGSIRGAQACLPDGTGFGPCTNCGGSAGGGGSIADGGNGGGGASPGSGGTGGGGQGGQAPVGGGGAGGSGGSGGSGGNGGSMVDPCPSGLPGPTLVEVPSPLGGEICIDATEVSNADYDAFLATNPSVANQPSYCQWNADLTPSAAWPYNPMESSRPVVWIDWCDAYAYCAGVGKRLCGGLGGGPTAFGGYADPMTSHWFSACSCYVANLHAYAFPYGDTYQPTTCNGNDNGASFDMLDVGTQPGCQCPFPQYAGIFDMSGNAYEWEDSCDAQLGSSDNCRLRGGGTNEAQMGLRCDANLTFSRTFSNDLVGFRCCYP